GSGGWGSGSSGGARVGGSREAARRAARTNAGVLRTGLMVGLLAGRCPGVSLVREEVLPSPPSTAPVAGMTPPRRFFPIAPDTAETPRQRGRALDGARARRDNAAPRACFSK